MEYHQDGQRDDGLHPDDVNLSRPATRSETQPELRSPTSTGNLWQSGVDKLDFAYADPIERTISRALRTPMTPESKHLQEPGDSPLGVLAAVNAYHRGESSTGHVVEDCLPTRLLFHKPQSPPQSPTTRSSTTSTSTSTTTTTTTTPNLTPASTPPTSLSLHDLKSLTQEELLNRLRSSPPQPHHHLRRPSVPLQLQDIHPAFRATPSPGSPPRNNAFAQSQSQSRSRSRSRLLLQQRQQQQQKPHRDPRLARPSNSNLNEVVRKTYKNCVALPAPGSALDRKHGFLSTTTTTTTNASPTSDPSNRNNPSPTTTTTTTTPDQPQPPKSHRDRKLAQLIGKEYLLLRDEDEDDNDNDNGNNPAPPAPPETATATGNSEGDGKKMEVREVLREGRKTLSSDVKRRLRRLLG